jgi:hypothetical protein
VAGSPGGDERPGGRGGWGEATTRRLIAAVVALVCAGVLAVATQLTPASAGLGTHEQLMLPPCGWIAIMDTPCPTCGMTTSFAYAADGRLLAALRAQPLGCLLAVATAMTLIIATYIAITGSPITRYLVRLWTPRSGWYLAGLVIAAWTFKVLSHRGVL